MADISAIGPKEFTLELEAIHCFFGPFTLKTKEMAYPAPTKGFSWPSTDTAMLFATLWYIHPPPTFPPFLVTQNLAP